MSVVVRLIGVERNDTGSASVNGSVDCSRSNRHLSITIKKLLGSLTVILLRRVGRFETEEGW